jgi:16S rRNA (cytosine967-C5)-methyltransferase
MQISGKETSSANNNNHFQRYLQYADAILSSYHGHEPFHIFIKKYFSLNKKHGSKDRKLITALCYNFFRIGFGVSTAVNQNEKFYLSTFLCETNPSSLLQFFMPEWNSSISLPLTDKLKIAGEKFNVDKLFPFMNELSNEINVHQFNLSFLIQPKIFIRIRPESQSLVINKIKQSGFAFEQLEEDCIAFANNEKVTDAIKADKEAVVQDYSSQRTLDLLRPLAEGSSLELSIWDCCAGSGGKSILAFDLFKKVRLTVSDRRKIILENLKLRFGSAGIKDYKLLSVDLEKSSAKMIESFDIIIADVPCTGSGTWVRTPEQLHFFKNNETEKYSLLQRRIVDNVLPHLKTNGHLLYITCSGFKKENEENVAFFKEKYKLNLIKSEYLKGYEMQADTLFVALFTKSE